MPNLTETLRRATSHSSGASFGPSAYWHPFSDLHQTRQDEFVITEGRGVRVRDQEGRWYYDATASLWYANVGHGQEAIVSAIADQSRRLAAYSTFGDFTNPATAELAERLAELSPIEDPVVFLTSGGSDAVDSAVKIARRYWQLVGEPERRVIISREHSYHGMHGHGTALAGIAVNASGYGDPGDPSFAKVPHEDAAAIDRLIRELGPTRVAAFFVEPIIGAGGVIPAPPGYLQEISKICRLHDVLLVVDEVISGFGRTGRWFASDSYGLTPDLLLFAKGVTSGYLPLGGVLITPRVWTEFAASHAGIFRHGYTYSGHATACAAATANIDILKSQRLLPRVQDLVGQLHTHVDGMRQISGVREIRQEAYLAALAFDTTADPQLPQRVVAAARRNGVLTRIIAGDSIQISPPFVISDAELADMFERLAAAVREAVEDSAPAQGEP